MAPRIKLHTTPDQRRLHIGNFFTDLNEADYQDLLNIFGNHAAKEVASLKKQLEASKESESKYKNLYTEMHKKFSEFINDSKHFLNVTKETFGYKP